jgi:ParB/RepB/Spo0J family partition protein
VANEVKLGYAEIPLELIETGPGEVRTRRVDENIDELANNIALHGLLQPIVVFYREENKKYELIIGQRRFLAVTKLGWPKIPAKIIKRPKDEAEAKAMSYSENAVRQKLPKADEIDVCKYFYDLYGTYKDVAEKLAINATRVKKVLRLYGAPNDLKKAYEDQKVSLEDAMKVLDVATTPEGVYDDKKAEEAMGEMKIMSNDQKARLVELAEENPTAPISGNLAEKAKAPREEIELTIHLGAKYADGLDNAAKDLIMSREDAAKTGIVSWLRDEGYIK